MLAPSRAPRILVADDQKDILEALKLLLKGEGYEVDTATSPRAVLSALDKRDFDALLIDMNYARDTTSGAEGLDLLARLQALDAPPPVVVMTAWASIDGAVEAMRRGARDFIEKPWDNRRLLATLRTHVELGRALRRSQQLESELFGHVKGAFTDAKVDRVGRFELAEGGTLFLDEIANLPLAQQAKLLRVLETGEFERVGSSKTQRVSVRVISATNADIPAEAAAGKFRQDLLFRLNTVEVRLPPLRERPEDVPLLASHFGRRHAARYRKRITGFAVDAMQALRAHPWPGNVRELDHAVERAVLLAEGDVIRARDLALGAPADGAAALEQTSLEEVERGLVQKALSRAGGDRKSTRLNSSH